MNRKERRRPNIPRPKPDFGVNALFAAAVQEHGAGRLGPAEQLYRRVLAADPKHADSLHRLGFIAYQVGQHTVAAELIGRAIVLDRSVAAYHAHLSSSEH